MDGVLADLLKHATNAKKVKHYLELSQRQWDEYYQGVDALDLFSNLDPFPSTNAVIETANKLFGHYNILSRPLEFDVDNCIKGKNKWIDTHLNIQPKKRFFTPDKWKFATQPDGTPNVLVDDHRTNITLWNNHGGIGIKWQADEDSFDKLKHLLIEARSRLQ